tara:strand:+ start:4152 stop:5732 length:1581 start_codon:yes stop_codon:yes gene_type:complete
MYKKSNYTLLLFALIAFSIYCALSIGEAWDERYEILRGKTTLEYFFSLGKINNNILYREYNSTIYYTLLYFFTTIFPNNYQIEVSHLINMSFSIATIFGISKVCNELFNKKVGKITFLILFLYPIFFGHMAFNSKDTIIAFSHVWIVYLLFRYIKNQEIKEKTNSYILFIAILAATATGIKFVFLGTLIPVLLFFLIDVFYFKKITSKKFNKVNLLKDIIKCFLIFYFLLIIFWIDVYSNIFVLPLEIIQKSFSNPNLIGWPYNLMNGNYFTTFENNIPKFYLLINLFYKSPEYILALYLIFFFLFINFKFFLTKKIDYFIYKLFFIIFILAYANLITLIAPFPVYDGIRLFYWTIPYFCIIPGLTVYYLVENIKLLRSKICLSILAILFGYYLLNFINITPYHYTYLNIFSGKNSYNYNKFENDYWGASLKELIENTNFNKGELITFATCGVEINVVKSYLKKKGLYYFKFENENNADYIIMTNRSIAWNNKITNCFNKYRGKNIYEVQRNGLILSVIRKNNFKS